MPFTSAADRIRLGGDSRLAEPSSYEQPCSDLVEMSLFLSAVILPWRVPQRSGLAPSIIPGEEVRRRLLVVGWKDTARSSGWWDSLSHLFRRRPRRVGELGLVQPPAVAVRLQTYSPAAQGGRGLGGVLLLRSSRSQDSLTCLASRQGSKLWGILGRATSFRAGAKRNCGQ